MMVFNVQDDNDDV